MSTPQNDRNPCAFLEEEVKKNEFLVTRPSNQKSNNDSVEDEKVTTSIVVFGKKISLYISKKLWLGFQEVARLEAASACKLAEKAFTEYVMRHGKGNPQIRISNYILDEPTPSAHFCNYSKGNTNDGYVFCCNPSMVKTYEMVLVHGSKGLWLSGITCYSCTFNKLRKQGDIANSVLG